MYSNIINSLLTWGRCRALMVEFQYLGGQEKMQCEMDGQIGTASAPMRSLRWSSW